VQDQGALPCVIAARLESAVREAGVAGGDARPERTASLPAASARDRLRRSRLYLPGNDPKLMINAGLHGPDGIILDLEDSVHPDHKAGARLLVRNALRCVDFGACERMVRINPLPLGVEDLEAVVPELPDLILVPKAEHGDEIRDVSSSIERILGRIEVDRPVWLMPIVETALGVENAFEIALASQHVVAVTLGLEDYTADLGVAKTVKGDETLYARMRVVNAARAAGLQPIDSVFGDAGDAEGLRQWAVRSRGMGFEGMGCIHPRQIATIHDVFRPSDAEIERASRIVAAFEDAQNRGLAVVSLGSKMIDPPVVERAQKLVDRGRALGLVPLDDLESEG
jgi:citrate lyase subunit beta/citryl-CoA lyase